jgi:hypothetical protein
VKASIQKSILLPNEMSKMLFLGLFGAAIGVVVVLVNSRSPISEAFISTPEFVIWLLLICSQTAFLAMAIGPMVTVLQQLKTYSSIHKWNLALSGIIITILFWIPSLVRVLYISDIQWPIANQTLRLSIIILIAYVPTLMATVGIWLIQVAFQSISHFESGDLIPKYLQHLKNMRGFLAILGIMVSLATLATASLRNALIAVDLTVVDKFPEALVWIYGAYYSVLLLLIYLPAYNAGLIAGEEILDRYLLLPLPIHEDWTSIYTKRTQLAEYLGLEESIGDSLHTLLPILAPLISGFIPTLLSS